MIFKKSSATTQTPSGGNATFERLATQALEEEKKQHRDISNFEAYKELRSEIAYEANLAINRTSWFVGSQAFLFAAISSGIKTTGTGAKIADSLFYPLVPTIGLLISIVTLASVCAAFHRARMIAAKIREDFERFMERYKIRENGVTAFLGISSTIAIPTMFAIAWVVILVQAALQH